MSFTTRRRLAVGLLCVAAAWPPLHFALVRSMDWSPWKGAGWAMYTEPMRRITALAVSVDDGRQLGVQDLDREAAREIHRAYRRFSERRRHFGRSVRPDAFGAAILRHRPGVSAVEVVVERYQVDRATARTVKLETGRYRYRR